MRRLSHTSLLPSLLGLLLFLACRPNSPAPDAGLPAYEGKKSGDNSVRLRIAGDPGILHPLLSKSGYATYIERHIFQTLGVFDPQSFAIQPHLAIGPAQVERIETGELAGGYAYTFELRPEARWDNGRPISAEDVAFSLKALLNPALADAARYRSFFSFVKDFRSYPDNPRRFSVLSKDYYMLAESALATALTIYPAHHYDPEGMLAKWSVAELAAPGQAPRLEQDASLRDFAEQFRASRFSNEVANIQGSGPYRITQWDNSQRVVLEKKSNWWGDGLAEAAPNLRALPDRLIYEIYPDNATALTALRNEDLDVYFSMPSSDYLAVQAEPSMKANYTFSQPPYLQVSFYAINHQHPILAERAVRRAIAHLVDVETAIAVTQDGLAEPISGPFHPSKTYARKDLTPIAFDPQQAADLLRAAGWADSDADGWLDKMINGQQRPLELRLLVSQNEAVNQAAILFQENAKKAGVHIIIDRKDFSALLKDVNERNYDMAAMGWTSTPGPEDPKQSWHSENMQPGGDNFSNFKHPEADRVIDALRQSEDEAERLRHYHALQQILYDEQAAIFLQAPLERIAIHRRFADAQTGPLRPGFHEAGFRLLGAAVAE